jgi:hypothetical protein
MPFSAAAELQDASEAAVIEFHQNSDELDEQLAKYAMTRRDDSKLGYRWCIGESLPHYPSIYDVAHEIAVTQTLYANTRMGDKLEDALRAFANVVHAQGNISWKETWIRVMNYGQPLIRVVYALGSEIPEKI